MTEVLNLGSVKIKRPAIVASLGADAELLAHEAEQQGADVIEVRLDLLENGLEALKRIRSSVSLPIIATNRIATEGGSFRGSEERRIDILIEASRFSDIVDIELMAPGRQRLLENISSPVIISYHDFVGMPDVRSKVRDAVRAGADIVKVAVTPHTLFDALDLLKVLLESEHPLCIIGMGMLGRHLRAVAPIYGSVLTYGYVKDPVAPGQMSVRDLNAVLGYLGAR